MSRLANDDITLTLGSQRFTLRASLRAVAAIAKEYNDFATLYADIARLNFGAADFLIEAACTDPTRYAMFSTVTANMPLQGFFAEVQPQLLTFIENIAGANSGKADAAPADRITLDELVERLFKVGAGWLEWPASEVWDSTVNEILLARDGLMEKLKAIHGSADKDDNGNQPATDYRSAKSRLAALGDLSVTRMSEVPQ